MVLDNDTRGWIMSCVSGIACVVGSSIICIDLIIRHLPGRRNFRIQDSSAFLSASLSLSFGVMLFSSLYSMLPSAQKYLQNGGLDASPAAYITIGCFLGGVIGIQIVSRILHHYIPSHVVDCDHEHDHDEVGDDDEDNHHDHQRTNGHSDKPDGDASEHTPLLTQSDTALRPSFAPRAQSEMVEGTERLAAPYQVTSLPRAPTLQTRPTMQTRLTQKMTDLVSGAKSRCDEGGPCYGFSDPCGHQCSKTLSRNPTRVFGRLSSIGPSRQPSILRSTTAGRPKLSHHESANGEADHLAPPSTFTKRPTLSPAAATQADFRGHLSPQKPLGNPMTDSADSNGSVVSEASDQTELHHHHVPENAFLSIGLQTSIAIALHKLPEGFITYATNHANPKLGFSVFMALFIHNITEGFAMALPLYLAIKSRWKAMFWSSLLGGVSQPLGAGVAALWFKIAGRGDLAPGDTVYGCMFSVTAGIMASVALQLYSESLTLTHNRNLCTTFAFLGMGILGVSYALTA